MLHGFIKMQKPWFIIKVLENTHTKKTRLMIEAVTKMTGFFTIGLYKTEEFKEIEISDLTFLEV